MTDRPGTSGTGPPEFTHAEWGTPEHQWLLDPRWDGVPALDPADLGASRVVVLAAHPDDETLGVGASLADGARAGARIDVVVATDGEASHPGSSLWSGERLAAVRRGEVAHALRVLAPGARLHHLGLPDGGLTAHASELAEALARAVDPPGADTLVLAPLVGDGHPDHDAVGAAALALAAATGARLLFYPVWLWQWGLPEGLAWDRLRVSQPSAQALWAKRAALAAHASQVRPLSPLPGDEVLLPPHVLARFERVVEVFVEPAAPATAGLAGASEAARRRTRAAAFDAMLDGGDPWDEHSWYERRKRALACACLARERYADVLEVGCSTGSLTVALAERAERVLALDVSARALARARDRGLSGVRWARGEAPYDLPDVPVDLVVLSEVGYFLTGVELLATLRHAARVLRPGGEILLVDWRARTRGIPLDGELVHAQARSLYDGLLGHRASYVDGDVRIDCWGGPDRLGPDRDAS